MRILIADDDAILRELLTSFFRKQRYEVLVAKDGAEAVKMADKNRPDLIILDVNMPKKDGYQACQEIRRNIRTRFIPILFLTANTDMSERLSGLSLGADDYLSKPFDPRELQIRVSGILLRNRQALGANPLTRLPGGIVIEEEATRRIQGEELFAFIYVDMDNFKVYNDLYGYHKGDDVIRKVAEVLTEAVEKKGKTGDFVGHIGGDDFVMVTIPERAETLSAYICKRFDESVKVFYNAKDQKAGFVETEDRHGVRRRFPLMTLTLAVVTNQRRTFNHYGQLAEIVAELKQYAKSKKDRKGSIAVFDRRTEEKPPAKKSSKNK